MTTREVAELFGRSQSAVRYWARRGKIPCRWFLGRLLFLRADIEDLVAKLKELEGSKVTLHDTEDNIKERRSDDGNRQDR